MQYQDNTTTAPTDQAALIHAYQMSTSPEYAADYNFRQATANQGLEDMSGVFIPAARAGQAFKGLGTVGRSGDELLAQQQLLRAGGQARTAEEFATQDALRKANISTGSDLAAQKGLGRVQSAQEFARQDALRAQAIADGTQQAKLANEFRTQFSAN